MTVNDLTTALGKFAGNQVINLQSVLPSQTASLTGTVVYQEEYTTSGTVDYLLALTVGDPELPGT